jgi:hypothetical protein
MFTVSIWRTLERFIVVNEFTNQVSALLRYRPNPASLGILFLKLQERYVSNRWQPNAQSQIYNIAEVSKLQIFYFQQKRELRVCVSCIQKFGLYSLRCSTRLSSVDVAPWIIGYIH